MNMTCELVCNPPDTDCCYKFSAKNLGTMGIHIFTASICIQIFSHVVIFENSNIKYVYMYWFSSSVFTEQRNVSNISERSMKMKEIIYIVVKGGNK